MLEKKDKTEQDIKSASRNQRQGMYEAIQRAITHVRAHLYCKG